MRNKELIVSVHTHHVVHGTEWSMGQNLGIAVEVSNGLVSEVPDLVHVGLVRAIEVLHVHVCG